LHDTSPAALVTQQVANPFACLPHTDLAAHFLTAPLQLFGNVGASPFESAFA
jgi:hypothetical protein